MIEDEKKQVKVPKIFQWIFGIGCLTVIIIFAVTCGSFFTNDSNTSTTTQDTYTAPSYPTVKYEIRGTARSVDITLNNPTGGTEQYSNAGLPSNFTYNDFKDNFLYISAQNQGEYGTVTVNILVNGILYKTSTSSGAYVIATASGSTP